MEFGDTVKCLSFDLKGNVQLHDGTLQSEEGVVTLVRIPRNPDDGLGDYAVTAFYPSEVFAIPDQWKECLHRIVTLHGQYEALAKTFMDDMGKVWEQEEDVQVSAGYDGADY